MLVAWAALTIAGCDVAPGPAPSEADRILDGAQRAVGTWPTPDELQLFAAASVEGPSGSFRTRVHSSGDGRVRLEQSRFGFLAGVGEEGGWRYDAASGEVRPLGDLEAFVRGHELHMLALLPRSRLSAPSFLGLSSLGSRDALSVSLSLPSGDSLVAFFDRSDTLPVGLRVLWGQPPVQVRWSGWVESGGFRFFRRATFRQDGEEYRYRYDTVRVGPIPDRVFEAPSNESLAVDRDPETPGRSPDATSVRPGGPRPRGPTTIPAIPRAGARR